MRYEVTPKSSADPILELTFFAYLRKSTESDERQVQSIPDQNAWMDTQDLNILEFFEESRSAKLPGRPQFNLMLDAVEAGKANAIVAYDVSRLTRNPIDGARLIGLLESGHLQRIVTTTHAYRNNSTDKFLLGFFVAESKRYTDNLSELTLRGMRSKASKGVYPGWAKLGYYNHPKTKEPLPDPEKCTLIAKAYELYATNKWSLNTLRHHLFDIGLTNRSGGVLALRQLTDLLTDPFYYGAFVWQRELWSGNHKPTVSKALWDKVQQVYTARGRQQSKWKREFPFLGLMRCAECGGAITAESHSKTQKNGNHHTWVYYRCTKKAGRVKCQQPFLREEALLEQILLKFREVALPDSVVLPMLEQIDRWGDEEKPKLREAKKALRSGIRDIEAQLRNLTDLAVEGLVDRADFAARKRKLINKKIALEGRLASFSARGVNAWLEPLRSFVNAVWEPNIQTAGADPLNLRDLVAEAGSNLLIHSGKLVWSWSEPFATVAAREESNKWWARGDSNPQGLPHQILNLARLPISPLTHIDTPSYDAVAAAFQPPGLRVAWSSRVGQPSCPGPAHVTQQTEQR
jgi:site-specific DNA recombinase